MRWEKLSTRGATTDWQSRLEPSVYTAASSSVVRDLYVQMACRHRYACAMWVDDWQECHAIVCQQPQERTPADVERLAIWLRTKSPLFQDLNEGKVVTTIMAGHMQELAM